MPGNLVAKKSNPSNLFVDNNNIIINTIASSDIKMSKNLINNGNISSSMGYIDFETFNERAYDDDKSSYQYNNNFINHHNINKSVTERNANQSLNFKNNANLISFHENSIYSIPSISSSSSSSSSTPSSSTPSLLSCSPETNVNNIISCINMQHLTSSSPNKIKKSFSTGSFLGDNNSTCLNNLNNDDSDTAINFSEISQKLPLKSSSVPALQNNDVDRVIITDDNIIKGRQQIRKQPPSSKIQRLKHTLSFSKKFERGEEIEEEAKEEEVIDNTCNNHSSLSITTNSPSPLRESSPPTMSRGSFIIKRHCHSSNDNMKSALHRLSRSVTKLNSNDITTTTTTEATTTMTTVTTDATPTTTTTVSQDSRCICSDKNIRKRVISNNAHRFWSNSSSSSSSLNSEDTSSSPTTPTTPTSPTSPTSPATSISTCDSVILESRDQSIDAAKIKVRNSMDDQSDFDIRRSWSHIEVRHIKGLFKRHRHVSDVQRRNSYAYANSSSSESSKVENTKNVNNVNNDNVAGENSSSTSDVEQASPKKFTVDLYALQADMAKETDVITRSRQMRKFIISEIYSTEQSYLSHMKTLKKTFMDPCINASTAPLLINKDDIRVIFAHLDDLIKLSDTIVETLETSMDPQEIYDSKLGHAFLKHEEELGAFKKYAENIQRSRQLLNKKVNQSVFYRKFISSQRKKENIKLCLNDYMIMPIQRITRYSMLLRDLKKYTSESHPDYNELCKALDNMISLAAECNNNVQDAF